MGRDWAWGLDIVEDCAERPTGCSADISPGGGGRSEGGGKMGEGVLAVL